MNTLRAGAGLLLLVLATGAAAHAPGDRVLAVWGEDGLWYPARVEKVDAAGVHVLYDDGDTGVVKSSEVGPIDWKAGTVLQCNWKNQGKYYRGVVETVDGEKIEFHYDDGYKESITISRCRGLAPAAA